MGLKASAIHADRLNAARQERGISDSPEPVPRGKHYGAAASDTQAA